MQCHSGITLTTPWTTPHLVFPLLICLTSYSFCYLAAVVSAASALPMFLWFLLGWSELVVIWCLELLSCYARNLVSRAFLALLAGPHPACDTLLWLLPTVVLNKYRVKSCAHHLDTTPFFPIANI